MSKTLQCDSSIGMRLESNSVGGKLTFNGAFSQFNRSLYLGGTGTGDNALATAFTGSGGIDWTDGTLNITGTFVPGNLGSLRFGTRKFARLKVTGP